jgi:hypothetical protein
MINRLAATLFDLLHSPSQTRDAAQSGSEDLRDPSTTEIRRLKWEGNMFVNV